MALNNIDKPKYYNTINTDGGSLVNATGAATVGSVTNMVTVFTAGAYGSIVDRISISSNDTAAMNVIIATYDGTTLLHERVINVPTLSGTNGTAAVIDALSAANAPDLPVDNNLKRYMRLKPNHTIKVGVLVAVTAAKTVWVKASGLDAQA